ncbi:hypothetical protein [Xanthobacter sediminis]
MSLQAIVWAKAQRTGSPGRKVLLLALADRAAADGEAHITRLLAIRETELPSDALSSTLLELNAGGFISSVSEEHGLISATLAMPSGR